MGMGIPVLHGVAGESAEIVEREGVGLVFEPEHAQQLCERLCALKNDRALYDSLRAGCLNAAPHYDRAELAARMLSVLEGMIPRRIQKFGGMRLLFINRYFYPDISATSQLLTELAEDLDAKGDRVTVITGKTAYFGEEARLPDHEMHRGIRIVRVGFTRFGRSHTLGRLADYLSFWISALWAAARTKNQDCLVVLSDPPLLSVVAALVRSVKPVKTVCWLQDVFPEVALRAGILREGMVARLLRRIAQWSLRRMDRVVVIGRCMERHLLSEGLPPHTLVHIPNWADGRRIRPVPRHDNAFLREQGLQNRFVVMYSGNHGVVHDFETIFALIRKTRYLPGVCFCFVGEGAWRSQLVETAQAEGWQHVVFLPYQPKAMLQSSLSAADVHLVSLRTEMEGLSIPSKIYGVLAAGRPVIFIGPSDSEPAAIVREGEFGYSVLPGDTQGAFQALLAAYRDHTLLERQGQAARQYFNTHCDRSIATEQFRQVLQRVAVPSSTQPVHMRAVSPPTRSQ
jgi:glycosyltransferase involved in cell wall biosynthesis